METKKGRFESANSFGHRQGSTAILERTLQGYCLKLVMRANTAIYKRPNLQITDWPSRVVQMPSGKELDSPNQKVSTCLLPAIPCIKPKLMHCSG
jgi:hypothetical protein